MKDKTPSPEHPVPFVGSEFPDDAFRAIAELLLDRRGFDLHQYKDRCIKRRIAARVRSFGYHSAPPYLERLRRDESEADALIAALSIHVSQFFRNPSTFAALEEDILPDLIRRATACTRRRLRLWSVGCAGGEEPYSLALLAAEKIPPTIQVSILGTDISEPVLQQAREGLFDPLRLADVPPTIRERYFTREGQKYRLAENICKMVEFQRQDIAGTEEYPDADLILCRNVLIYFSREQQEAILSRFAEALPAGGYLVLGRSETLMGDVRRHFRPECSVERIYRRNPAPEPGGKSHRYEGADRCA